MGQFSWKKIASPMIVTIVTACLWHASPVVGQQDDSTLNPKKTVEPVFRVSKLTNPQPNANANPASPITPVSNTKPNLNDIEKSPVEASLMNEPALEAANPTIDPSLVAGNRHPLDEAIEMAQNGLRHMRENVSDYTAVLVKRERVGDTLSERQYMALKIRHERETNQGRQPFSIYMKFLKPRANAGREVIWVNGRNNNKLLAHEAGLLGVRTFHLDPEGWLAMKGQRYPIYDAGLENLIIKLIEKAERDRAAGLCTVEKRQNAMINNRPCTMMEVTHNERKVPYEFYKAQVFVDDELQVPVRYAAYDWPIAGQKPQLLEEYTYINVKLNVGLTDVDFDHMNPQYQYKN